MKIILLQNVPGLGQKNDIKEVKEGYATNLLIPKKMAKLALSGDIKQIQSRKENNAKKGELLQKKVKKLLSDIDGKYILIKEKANEKGHLFAQVHAKEIADAIGDLGFDISEDWIILEKPIKEVGKFSILILAYKKEAKVKLEIAAI